MASKNDNDFFSTFENNSGAPREQQPPSAATASTRQRRAPAPPAGPPPPPAAAAAAQQRRTSAKSLRSSSAAAPAASSRPAAPSATSASYYASTVAPPVAAPAGGATTSLSDTSGDWYNYSSSATTASQQQQQPLLSQPVAATAATAPSTYYGGGPTGTAASTTGGPTSAPSAPQQQQPTLMMPLQQQPSLQGTMDTSAPAATPQPSLFVPQPQQAPQRYDDDLEHELPLLEELGINLDHIGLKTMAVVIPSNRLLTKASNVWHRLRKTQPNASHHTALEDPELLCQDADLAGPLVFALALGGEMLLDFGKVSFGYIYGFGLFGCLSMTLMLNLMSPQQAVSVWTVASILGYSLLPVNVLAALKLILALVPGNEGWLLYLLGALTVAWSTTASTRLLEVACAMRNQRYLMAYPIMLLYSAFVLMTVF